MGPPSRFRERGVSRFGHRGALEPPREHLDRLGERLDAGLEQAYTSLDGGYRRGPGLSHLSHEARLPRPGTGWAGSLVTRRVLRSPVAGVLPALPCPGREAHPGCMPGGLLTDLYELNMAVSYLRRGMTGPATFSLFVRRLPPDRGFWKRRSNRARPARAADVRAAGPGRPRRREGWI